MSLKTVAPKPRVRKTNLGYKVYYLMSNKMFLDKVANTLWKAIESGDEDIPQGTGAFLYHYSRSEIDKKVNPSAKLVKFVEENVSFMPGIDLPDDYSFKDIKRVNDRNHVEIILNQVVEGILWERMIEETKENADRYFFMISKKYLKECKNDWFALARYYDETGGEPKDWYEMNKEWNLSVEEQRTKSLVFIYNMWLFEELFHYFEFFMDEFLDEAERLEL